jgi:hypothetical protein
MGALTTGLPFRLLLPEKKLGLRLTHPEFRTLYAREGTGVPLRLEDRGPETHPIDAAIFGEGPGRPGPIFGMI